MIILKSKSYSNLLKNITTLIVIIILSACIKARDAVPENNPENWLLAFVDVETTGLKPGYHEMIDIGVILSDLEGKEIGRTFLRIMPAHPERAAQGAIDINGFSLKRWKKLGALQPSKTVDSLIRFHKKLAKEKNILMVAYNSQFDAAFIDHLFRSSGKNWRDIYYYYVLDIPSMAWSRGIHLLHGSKLSEYFGIPDEPHTPTEHTGMTGADLNFRLYKKIINRK